MPVTGGVITRDNTAELTRALRLLADTTVLVGVPADDEQPHLGAGRIGPNERDDGEINNATLGYIHEHGAPEINLPARPHLVPGVEGARDAIMQRLRDAGEAALAGNAAAVEKNLHAAGITAQTAVRNKIASNIPPPLKPGTVRARRRRTQGSSYRRKATIAAQVVALIDTAQYLNSISYVIRRR